MSRDMSRAGQLARRERVVRLTREGLSATDIAWVMGISARAVVRNRRAAGLTADYRRPAAPSEAEILAGKRLLARGASYNEVARSYGFHPDTWRKHCPGYGWSASECGLFAKAVQQFGRAVRL